VGVALGAQASEIARMVFAEGARIALMGALLGGVGALAVAKLLASPS
jgi:ABC-type lipoprotein release transport system permease subunit